MGFYNAFQNKEGIQMSKKAAIFLTLSALILVVLAGAWRSASAAVTTDNSIAFGKQGIFIPAGFSPENVSLKREFRGAPVVFKRPLLDLAYHSDAGSRVNTPFTMTYVWYTLSKSETKQWEAGNLSIYYKELISKAWRPCPTVAVNSGSEEGSTTTVSCVATQGTVYGLGKSSGD
jgi:hypothetical protein